MRTMMSKKWVHAALAGVVVVGVGVMIYNSDALKERRFVNGLVARNTEARGGAEAWEKVSSLRMEGQMDLGQGMAVPYELAQKRPGKMCFSFVFDGKTAMQCADGDAGWKLTPFLGRLAPEPMSETELRETADSADLLGLLFNYSKRGHKVKFLGNEEVNGRDTYKLQVTLPRGAVRWVYLDAETALEVRVESERILRGKPRLVITEYSDWQATDGLLIARRQETLTEGDKESHYLTVERVNVNPALDDSRFDMPITATALANNRSDG